MVTRFANADGSITVRSNGYSLDLSTQLVNQLAFLQDTLGAPSNVLDWSLASLLHLDDLLTERKRAALPFPQTLTESVVAYCGEVLRRQVEGEWFYYVAPADQYGGERYFPGILSAAGYEIDFYGIVEKELERSSGSYLNAYLIGCLAPPLPVQPLTAHPAGDNFPPLLKKPHSRRIFPSKGEVDDR